MLMLCLSMVAAAPAAPPLIPAADVAEPALMAWWREGDLLVGVPTREGRPGLRPLVSLAPVALPASFDGWTPIGESCEPDPTADAVIDGQTVTAEVEGPLEAPLVVLRSDDRVLASNVLSRPVRACDLRIAQADDLPGLEVIVAWRQGVVGPDEGAPPAPGAVGPNAPPDAPDALRGIIVYHIPETAR